jgi:hypothetical protein
LTSIVRDEQEPHRHLEDSVVDLENLPLGGSGTAIGGIFHRRDLDPELRLGVGEPT